MHYLLKHLTHLLTATNQHGIHSPFVYDFVTKCLYSKEKHSKIKSVNILLKSIPYFEVRTLMLPSEAKELEIITEQQFPELLRGIPPYDFVFSEASNIKKIEKLVLGDEKIHNDSVVMLNNIHKSKATELIWEQLKSNEKITITIDLFYCGLIFFRKEQAKEHFKIRI